MAAPRKIAGYTVHSLGVNDVPRVSIRPALRPGAVYMVYPVSSMLGAVSGYMMYPQIVLPGQHLVSPADPGLLDGLADWSAPHA